MPDIIYLQKVRGLTAVMINDQFVDTFLTERKALLFLKRAEDHYLADYGVPLGWNIVVPPAPLKPPRPLKLPKQQRQKPGPRPGQPTKSSIIRAYVLARPGETLRSREVEAATHLNRSTIRATLYEMRLAGLITQHSKGSTAVWIVKEAQ